MTPRRAVVVAIAVGAGGVAMAAAGSRYDEPWWQRPSMALLVVLGLAGCSFAGVGLFVWSSSYHADPGRLLTYIGVIIIVFGALITPATSVLADATIALLVPLLAHALLSHPTGELDRVGRRIVGSSWVIVVGAGAAMVATTDPRPDPCAPACSAQVFLVGSVSSISKTAQTVLVGCAAVAALSVIVALARRWHVASIPARRALTPVLWAIGPLASLAAILVLGRALQSPGFDDPDVLTLSFGLLLALLPCGFLLGVLRTRLAQLAVARLVRDLEQGAPLGRLEGLLRAGLGDPRLLVGFWSENAGAYIDAAGGHLAVDTDDPATVVTEVDHDATRLAVVIHDSALDADLVQTAGAAAALALENERLHAELRAQLQAVQASRARLVHAEDQARRAVERDLHDGAQQRLVSLSLALEVARTNLRDEAPDVTRLLATAAIEAQLAVDELRALARGIHPAVLTQAGLDPAIRSLAERGTLPVDINVTSQRFPPYIEATAYYVVAEALTNAAKHAAASSVLVRVAPEASALIVKVVDDGCGGAVPSAMSGLQGLSDRVEAINGQFTLHSPAGEGTALTAVLPCE